MPKSQPRGQDEEPDLHNEAILAMIESVERNLESLYRLIEHHPSRTGDYRRTLSRLESRLADAVEGPVYNRKHAKLTQEFLRIRTEFWVRLLSTPDPRKTFVKWLKHLDEIASGRRACLRFERDVLGRDKP